MINKKIIIIDFGKISTPYCGLAETSLNYAKSLEAIKDESIEYKYIVPIALRAEFESQVGVKAITPTYSGLRRLLYYVTRQKKFLCELPPFDLYHYLHFYSPWGPNGKSVSKFLLTVHDLHALERKRAAKRLHLKVAAVDYIAFISQFASGEFKKKIQCSDIPTYVIPNGVKVPPVVDEALASEWTKKHGDFLFTLGGLKRKNIHSLLGMMQKLDERTGLEKLKLLVAGSIKEKYKSELRDEIRRRGIGNKIIFMGAVSEDIKFQLMQSCIAFVFPSFQEGFGLPIIEAMHFGKPVFCSNKTSLPEVGGGEAYYWENFESEYMANVLYEGLREEKSISNERIKQRREYAKSFDWNKNAQTYLELYKEILRD